MAYRHCKGHVVTVQAFSASQVSLRALFQTEAGTRIEPLTFRNLARKLHHMNKE